MNWLRKILTLRLEKTRAWQLPLLAGLLLLFGLGAGCVTEPAAKSKYPEVKLSNGVLTARIFLPDPARGYYRGPRFDWSGLIARVEYKGHSYFSEWKTPHNPEGNDDVIGTAEEFSMGILGCPPLGFAEAKTGEPFVKIGVGVLAKTEVADYRFYTNYKRLRPGQWQTASGPDWLEFRQRLAEGAWAYLYTKRLTLPKDKPQIIIARTLKNTGQKTIETTHYGHNFITIDDHPIGPSYLLRFPFTVKATGDLRGIARTSGKELRFLKEITEGAVFSTLAGAGNSPLHHEVVVTNEKTGAGIKIQGSLPVMQWNFFAVRTAVCPEPYVRLKLAPGEELSWQSTYTFFTSADKK